MSEDLYTAAVTVAIWLVIILAAVGLVLGTAFLYRVVVERAGDRWARARGLSDQTWRSRR